MVLILVERVTFINEKKKGRVKFTESRKFLETFNVKQNGRFKRDTRWQWKPSYNQDEYEFTLKN